jgi:hypothetical protein
MQQIQDVSPLWLIVAGATAALLVLTLIGFWLKNRRGRRLERLLRRHSWDVLRDVVIPDGLEGRVHIDRLLLTPGGLVVLEIKALSGAIFGAEKMDEWVVLEGGRRHGFRNPLCGLDERMTAIRLFAPGVHAEGYILVTGDAEFPKGRPERTLTPDELAERLTRPEGKAPDGWQALWGRLASHVER